MKDKKRFPWAIPIAIGIICIPLLFNDFWKKPELHLGNLPQVDYGVFYATKGTLEGTTKETELRTLISEALSSVDDRNGELERPILIEFFLDEQSWKHEVSAFHLPNSKKTSGYHHIMVGPNGMTVESLSAALLQAAQE